MINNFARRPIFRLRGGIGNQLFIYSAAWVLSNQIETNPIFDSSGISHLDCISSIAIPGQYLSKFEEKIINFSRNSRYLTRKNMNFPDSSNPARILRNSYISGYFQDSTFAVILKKQGFFDNFIFSDKSKRMEDLFSEIYQENSTLMHLRFGDYRQAGETLGNLSQSYYKNAITGYSQIANNPIYVLSDEPEVARVFLKEFGDSDIRIVPRSTEISTFDYLRIFGAANRIILANSTFSWWGAFLAQNVETVLAPRPWYKNESSQAPILDSFYPSDFSTLKSDWALK